MTVPALLQRTTSLLFWGGISALFSLFLGMGAIAMSVLILLGLLFFLAMLSGPQLIAAFWLMGSPTIFKLANQILSALPFVTMERVMFVVLLGMAALKSAFDKKGGRPFIRVEAYILVFLAWALISLAVSTDDLLLRQDLWFYLQYAMPMLMFMLSRRIEWSEQGVKVLLACLTATGVILAVIGVLQGLLGISIFTMEYQQVTSGHEGRAYGTFTNAHTYIATLFVLLTVTVLQFGMYRDGLVRGLLLSAMAVMLLGIVLGQTRAPWGGAAIALFIIMLRDRSVRPLLVTGGVVALIAGGVLLYLKMDELGGFMDRITNLGTMAGRLAVWSTALNMIFHNPLTGVGFGAIAFEIHKPEYITGVGELTQQYAMYLVIPHNEYLHVAVLVGIPGLVVFLAIVTGLVRLMFGIHADANSSGLRRRLGLYVGSTIIGLLFNSLFSDTYVQDYFWVLTYFLAGFAAGMPARFGGQARQPAWGGGRIEGTT